VIEKRIYSLWKILLNTDQIGINDNFFQMGGDLLTAMCLVSLVHKENIAITVDQIFKNPVFLNIASKAREEVFRDSALPRFVLLEGLTSDK
jgi:aryl carrier-like protein